MFQVHVPQGVLVRVRFGAQKAFTEYCEGFFVSCIFAAHLNAFYPPPLLSAKRTIKKAPLQQKEERLFTAKAKGERLNA